MHALPKGKLRNFFTDNVNSILGAISLHLLIVVAFLWFKLGENRAEQKEQVLIEFNEEMLPPEETRMERPDGGEGEDAMPALDNRTVHSIASNVAAKLDEEISTQKYEQQVLQELGIPSLKTQSVEQQNLPPDENAIGQPQQDEQSESDFDVPNVLRKDNTTVSYFLENRYHKYVYIPTYKCQGGGTVILDIVIDQSGKVLSALISENKSTRDPCLLEEAYRSAVSAKFNSDSSAPVKQLGTITYVFLAQ